jgi:hypothetical protein
VTGVPVTGPPDALGRRIRSASLLVAAIAASVVALAGVGTVVTRAAGGGAPLSFMVGIVSTAFFALLGSVVYRRLNYQPERLRRAFAAGGEPGLADHMLRTTIVSSVLAEAVAILGLLMGIMTGDTYYLYALCAIALLGVLSNFPRTRRWRELSSEITARTQAEAASGGLGIGNAR